MICFLIRNHIQTEGFFENAFGVIYQRNIFVKRTRTYFNMLAEQNERVFGPTVDAPRLGYEKYLI